MSYEQTIELANIMFTNGYPPVAIVVSAVIRQNAEAFDQSQRLADVEQMQ